MSRVLLLVIVGAMACTPRASDLQSTASEEITLMERYNTLTNAIRAQPRVQVRNQQAFLRSGSTTSINGAVEMQFVVAGQFIGGLSAAEQIISLVDVERLHVLDAREGSEQFGLRGGNGVVVLDLFDSGG